MMTMNELSWKQHMESQSKVIDEIREQLKEGTRQFIDLQNSSREVNELKDTKIASLESQLKDRNQTIENWIKLGSEKDKEIQTLKEALNVAIQVGERLSKTLYHVAKVMNDQMPVPVDDLLSELSNAQDITKKKLDECRKLIG